jgi:hypothetical protein
LDVASNGLYCGALAMLSGHFPFSGQLGFVASGTNKSYYAALEVARGTLPALPVQFGISVGAITNSGGDTNAPAMVGSAALSAEITSSAGTNVLAGTYHLAMPAANFPIGNSYGTLTVAGNGLATLAMSLADSSFMDSAVGVTSGFLASNGCFPFFMPLYSGSKGLFMGEITVVTNSESTNAIAATNVTWIKLPGASKTFYPSGFNLGGIVSTNALALIGSSYSNPPIKSPNKFTNTLTIENFDEPGNPIMVEVVFQTNSFTVITNANNMNTNKVQLAPFDPATGLLSGTFVPDPINPSKTEPFKALFLLNSSLPSGQVFGYFIGTNATGTVQFGTAAP